MLKFGTVIIINEGNISTPLIQVSADDEALGLCSQGAGMRLGI